MELFRCERMQANISLRQCEINRKGKLTGPGKAPIKPCFACEGCPGLGEITNINTEEIMAKFCKTPECSKQVTRMGLCWGCLKKAGINPQTGDPLPVPAPVADPVSDGAVDLQPPPADSFPGTVTNADDQQVPFGVDAVIYLALREAWQEKEREWLCELSGLKPGKAIAIAHQMVTAVETMGY